ncbi:hypothetical protein FB45DRAFT_1037181 [Roridomyces roridus]|uniref:F-box domain-containing protein n=1 Tax=Roridomyces roridus TaxID=1738132 RepID=A0AAD7B798_9AGAR|nr:hypothetical protein FB45DRAFT_1037181 [Roridomyces roridus]
MKTVLKISGLWHHLKRRLQRPAVHHFEPPPKPPLNPEHNGRLPVNRLPPHILLDIFLLVCEPWFGSHEAETLIACSHVCASWRCIALDAPQLWVHVVFKSRAWVDTCLERSKSLLLVVYAEIRSSYVESLVCHVLAQKERIGRIHVFLAVVFQRALDHLSGPFPHVTHFSVENCLPPLDDLPPSTVPRFPALRYMSVWADPFASHIPAIPDQVVSLEIYFKGWMTTTWAIFSLTLNRLQHLSELTLRGFPAPASEYAQTISLPVLRNLQLSHTSQNCTHFIESLDSPKLRRFNIHLTDFDNLPALYSILSTRMPKPPKSMLVERANRYSAGGNDYLLWDTPLPDSVITASIALMYQNTYLPRDTPLDICLSWIVKVPNDDGLAKIFAALTSFVWVERLEYVGIRDWCTVPAELWRPFIARLKNVQVVGMEGIPPAGFLWALVRDLEAGSTPFLPALQKFKLLSMNCSTGSWLPLQLTSTDPTRAVLPRNSIYDLDDTRFLDLLVCYLELRPTALPRLELFQCSGYTGSEVKLLRRLVADVWWDGCGMMGGGYKSNGDEAGGLTIHHELISRQRGYEELLGRTERSWVMDGYYIWERSKSQAEYEDV